MCVTQNVVFGEESTWFYIFILDLVNLAGNMKVAERVAVWSTVLWIVDKHIAPYDAKR